MTTTTKEEQLTLELFNAIGPLICQLGDNTENADQYYYALISGMAGIAAGRVGPERVVAMLYMLIADIEARKYLN